MEKRSGKLTHFRVSREFFFLLPQMCLFGLTADWKTEDKNRVIGTGANEAVTM